MIDLDSYLTVATRAWTTPQEGEAPLRKRRRTTKPVIRHALIFDTEVTTIVGTGSINLAHEKLDLTLNQKTKNTSPLALRSPIYIHGSFAAPDVQVDKAHIAARGIGAVALGFINPLLALIPLVDPGPGKDSDCGQLVRDARTLPHTENKKTGPRS